MILDIKKIRRQFVLVLALANVILSRPAWSQEAASLINAIEQVAEKDGPAVVSISTEATERLYARGDSGNSYDEDSFSQFFEEFFNGSPEYERKRSGLGSGVIIDQAGYILTNEHVIRGADKITVTLSDRRSFPAQIKGLDSRSDLALIKIEAPNLPVATLGNSDNLKIGQWVVAIGNPFGHILDDPEPTVTQGVVSALHRALPVTSQQDSDYSDLIQTDAAINPGNSGGPLVNLNGEIVGINVAIFSTSGGYQGIGFAIPANYAKAIVAHFIKGEKIDYGWIGVSGQDLDERLVQYFGLTSSDGVLINRILENSPAQTAGLREGDIIISANNVRMRSAMALIKYITNAEIGKLLSLNIIRDQKEITIPVMVEKRPSSADLSKGTALQSPKPVLLYKHWRGMEVRDIPKEAAGTQQPGFHSGIVVYDIMKNSAAYEAGIRKGDVIVSVNKQPITNVKDFQGIVSRASGDCLIRTLRGHFVVAEDRNETPKNDN